MRRLNKRLGFIIISLLMLCSLFLVSCGKAEETPLGSSEKSMARESSESVLPLEAVNELPPDGIISQAQLETVAGKDQTVAFHGKDSRGIEYTWTFDCNQIQNPVEQNLLIDFTTTNLDEIKEKANHANDALMMTMHGKGLVCVPTLEIILPESWKSDTVLLLKEQNGKLAKMSDVTIESTSSAKDSTQVKKESDNSNEPSKGSTKLTMKVTTLDGDCYLVGGIVNVQKQEQVAKKEEVSESDRQDDNSSQYNDADDGNEENNAQSSGDSSSGDVANDQSEDTAHYCTISISCKTILNNMGNLTAGKEEFVPSNGWILKASEVEYTPGESVHDVLKRVCKDAGIHMESSYTPAYDSAYVEGINQLYEFDCGELSGWMYNVNGWFPNYGCSKYSVQDGDVINWVYTCDLGKDVGDNSMY